MSRFVFAISTLVALLLLSGCARFSYVEHRRGYKHLKHPYVRVRIIQTEKLTLDSEGPYELYCMFPTGEITDYFSNSDLIVGMGDSMLSVRQKSGLPLEHGVKRVVAVPEKESFFLTLNGESYRGIADIIVEDGGISVINAIYLEDYLMGVLPPEIGRHGRPELEALKAQAVASRTYALSRFRRNPARAYDMVNDVADQLYHGMSIEDRWINEAIRATRGEILLSDGQLITAYYHSTCGGSTDNIEDVWERQAKPYLKAQDDSNFCEWSKFYEWTYEWHPDQIEKSVSEYLRQKGRLKGGDVKIKDMRVVDRLPSGRIKILKIWDEDDEYLLFKDQIRWALLRPDREGAILPSTSFRLELDRDTEDKINRITAEGHGNGHGVGMCQCGALGRSRAGQRYLDILTTYYTNTDIVKVY